MNSDILFAESDVEETVIIKERFSEEDFIN